MPSRIIKTELQRDNLFAFLGNEPLPLTITWQKGKHRTNEQNRLQWLWAGEVSGYLGDTDAATVQASMKLEIGVPILRAENDDFREKYDRIIRPQTYEDKITIMRDFDFPVTSLMKVPQMIAYLDSIWAKYTAIGIELTDPDPEMLAYMARYRVNEGVEA